MSSFICNSRGSLQLTEVYANFCAERGDEDHPFASPINPETLPWCICGRCVNMDQPRENVCCRKRICCTTEEYFRATTLDHNVLQLQIRLAADYRVEVPNYSHNGYRKASCRQYILSLAKFMTKIKLQERTVTNFPCNPMSSGYHDCAYNVFFV